MTPIPLSLSTWSSELLQWWLRFNKFVYRGFELVSGTRKISFHADLPPDAKCWPNLFCNFGRSSEAVMVSIPSGCKHLPSSSSPHCLKYAFLANFFTQDYSPPWFCIVIHKEYLLDMHRKVRWFFSKRQQPREIGHNKPPLVPLHSSIQALVVCPDPWTHQKYHSRSSVIQLNYLLNFADLLHVRHDSALVPQSCSTGSLKCSYNTGVAGFQCLLRASNSDVVAKCPHWLELHGPLGWRTKKTDDILLNRVGTCLLTRTYNCLQPLNEAWRFPQLA